MTNPVHPAATASEQIEQLNGLSTAHVVARSLHVVTDLGVADLIADAPEWPDTLAAKTGVNGDALARVMRFLACNGVFVEHADGRFTHSDLSQFLRSDHPRSQRPWIRLLANLTWDICSNLAYSVRTGEPAVSQLDPPGLFPYLDAHPEKAAVFDAGMTSKSQGEIAAMLKAFDFSPFATIGDIGGGRGHLLSAILDATPRAKGVLFDQPQVVERASALASERLRMVGGDFFKDDLPSCDCYTLMSVIHDWNDGDSIAILRGVRKAARPGAKLLLCELLLPERSGSPYALQMDVAMLVITGGRERKLSQYHALLEASGWRLDRSISTQVSIAILESTAV